ncbi:MAG: trigger factor [Betaproteobacteria bacterium]
MQNTVETTGQLERRVNVAVPLAEIEGEVEKRLSRLAKTVKLPGFRPGHVPLKMVAQQYGPQLRSEVISDRVQASFNDAIRGQNLQVAGYPRIEPKPRNEAAANPDALEFLATFEVYPEIKLGDLTDVTIEKPEVALAPADVDATLEKLRLQRATFEPVARAAQPGDRVSVDFTGTIDGVEFAGGQARDFPIALGEGRMLPEFEAVLPGTAAGDSKAFDLQFPADYHGKDVAGKKAQFTLTVKAVAETRLPPMDDAFAKEFGIASGKLADLRAEVEQNLTLEMKRRIETVVKEQVLRGLRSKADFAVPASLVDAEAMNMLQRTAQNLMQQGVKREDIRLTPDVFRSQAGERVTLGLLMADLVRQHDLAAKAEQVRARVNENAQTYETPDAVVRWHYEKPERLAEFEAQAAEQNVVDWALSRMRVVGKPTSFDALMNAKDAAAA